MTSCAVIVGADTLIGGRGDDRMLDGDGDADELDCGAGRVDTISGYDEVDTLRGCENFGLGVSKLKVSGSEVELSWTHPTSWRKLRRLVLYVEDDLGAEGFGQIGEVHINVRHPRIETVCGVEVARGGRITRHGKTVTARFTLEIAPGWKGARSPTSSRPSTSAGTRTRTGRWNSWTVRASLLACPGSPRKASPEPRSSPAAASRPASPRRAR